MNKKIAWIVGVVVIVLIMIGLTRDSSNKTSISNSNPFKIGIVLPLTGPAGSFGEATKKSVELALSKLSEIDKSRLQIIYADDQFDPKQTVSVTQKLVDVDKVNAIIAYSSPSSVTASIIAEKSAIPMIGLGNSPDINSGKQWVVRYMLGADQQAIAIESFLLKDKFKRVAIIWNQSDGPKSVHDNLVKILPERGYTIVADESVTKNENDFKTSITKIRSSKPEVIIAYISPQVGVFAKQAKDANLNIPLVSGPVFEIISQIQAAQGGLDNQLFVGNSNVAFIDDYFAKYNSYPTIAGDYIYDAVTQLARIASGRNISNSEIINALKTNFTGVSGNYTYNKDGSFETAQVVKKWDGQKFVELK